MSRFLKWLFSSLRKKYKEKASECQMQRPDPFNPKCIAKEVKMKVSFLYLIFLSLLFSNLAFAQIQWGEVSIEGEQMFMRNIIFENKCYCASWKFDFDNLSWYFVEAVECNNWGGYKTILTDKDNGLNLSFKVNEKVLLKLFSNPTTGYTWQIYNYDKSIISIKDKGFYPYRPEVLGSSGEQAFEINCITLGVFDLVLYYKRPWEKDFKRIYQLRIKVEEND